MILMLALSCSMLSCDNKPQQPGASEVASSPDGIKLLYFHGKQRCVTCKAVEQHSKELVETAFADAIKRGDVAFEIVDIDANKTLAEKYRVTWSAFLLVNCTQGKEEVSDLTQFAFANARRKPDAFKAELKQKIDTLLNK